jgi:hypothetical protein
MAVNLSPVGGVAAQFFTNTGAVLTGGKLYTYAAGTTTPAATFTSANGSVAWTNPIVLDAAGRVPSGGEIWLTDGISYKFALKDSNDVLIATYDNVTGINSNFVSFTNQQQIVTATAGQTVFNLSISYQPATNSLSVFVDGVNQYGPGAQYAYTETDSDTVTFTNGLHVGAEVKFTTTQQQGAGAVNASQVTYDPAGAGAVATNVQTKLRESVSVFDFMTTAQIAACRAFTGTLALDTASVNAAIATGARTIFFPSGTYLITSMLTQSSYQKWQGEGGQRATTLKKMFNGDLLTMGTLGELNDLNFDGNGATYSGRNIIVPAGCFSPRIVRCRSTNTQSVGLYFEANAGGGTVVDTFEANSMDVNVSASIGGAGDTGATPRFFNNMWLSGHTMAINGWNDTFINNTYLRTIIFSSTTANAYISNTRFASSSAAITIQGAGVQLSNCAFAGVVTLQNSSGISFSPTCEFGFAFVEDSTALFTSLFLQQSTYAGTWTQPSGVQPVLGNGTITSRALRNGRECTIQFELIMGSSTTYGNNSQPYQILLPYLSNNAMTQNIVTCAEIKCAGVYYTAGVQIAALSNKAGIVYQNTAVRDSYPGAWTSGDYIKFAFSYLTK